MSKRDYIGTYYDLDGYDSEWYITFAFEDGNDYKISIKREATGTYYTEIFKYKNELESTLFYRKNDDFLSMKDAFYIIHYNVIT